MRLKRPRIRRASESWHPGFFINAVHAFSWRENSGKTLAKYINAHTTGPQLPLGRRWSIRRLIILTYEAVFKNCRVRYLLLNTAKIIGLSSMRNASTNRKLNFSTKPASS